MQANAANPPRRRRNRRRAGMSEAAMLTGGTMDVKPQLLSFACVQSSADTTTTTTQPVPVLRNFSSGNGSRAQLIEVLKVYCNMPLSSEVDSSVSIVVGTKNLGTTAVVAGEPSVFARFGQQLILTTSGQCVIPRQQMVDCSDGAGNGILVATDNIYAQISSLTTSATNQCTVAVLYRVYAASVTEYVGIVQGQQ